MGVQCFKYFSAGYVVVDGLSSGCCEDLSTRSASLEEIKLNLTCVWVYTYSVCVARGVDLIS